MSVLPLLLQHGECSEHSGQEPLLLRPTAAAAASAAAIAKGRHAQAHLKRMRITCWLVCFVVQG